MNPIRFGFHLFLFLFDKQFFVPNIFSLLRSHFDCAPVYLNEKSIGKVLKEWIDSGKVKREDLFITTKLPPHGMNSVFHRIILFH